MGVPPLFHRSLVRHYVTGAQWELGKYRLRAQRLAQRRSGMHMGGAFSSCATLDARGMVCVVYNAGFV